MTPPIEELETTDSAMVIRGLSRQHILLGALLPVLALTAGVGLAGARGTTPAASLKVSMPASMARGSVLTVRARGYSGKYDAVSWSSSQGGSSPCTAPTAGTIGMQTVPRHHTYNVKFTNIFGAPGTLTVCVYLYASGPHADTKGQYLVKNKHVKVS